MINNSTPDPPKEILNPDIITKYINQLTILPVFYPSIENSCDDRSKLKQFKIYLYTLLGKTIS